MTTDNGLPDHTAVLYINRSDSRCGYCNKGCDPYQVRHEVEVGYVVDPGTPGCGAKFVALSSDYGDLVKEAATDMRPDLPWTTTLH